MRKLGGGRECWLTNRTGTLDPWAVTLALALVALVSREAAADGHPGHSILPVGKTVVLPSRHVLRVDLEGTLTHRSIDLPETPGTRHATHERDEFGDILVIRHTRDQGQWKSASRWKKPPDSPIYYPGDLELSYTPAGGKTQTAHIGTTFLINSRCGHGGVVGEAPSGVRALAAFNEVLGALCLDSELAHAMLPRPLSSFGLELAKNVGHWQTHPRLPKNSWEKTLLQKLGSQVVDRM